MVVSRVEGSHFDKRHSIIQVDGDDDDAIIIFGINRSGVFRRSI
jgi:hypothetical protein